MKHEVPSIEVLHHKEQVTLVVGMVVVVVCVCVCVCVCVHVCVSLN